MYTDTVSTLTTMPRTVACCHSHQTVRPSIGPLPGWLKFLNSINHLLPCKATWAAIKDNKIIAWHDGPHWFITRYLNQMHIKADFCGLVQRPGRARRSVPRNFGQWLQRPLEPLRRRLPDRQPRAAYRIENDLVLLYGPTIPAQKVVYCGATRGHPPGRSCSIS